MCLVTNNQIEVDFFDVRKATEKHLVANDHDRVYAGFAELLKSSGEIIKINHDKNLKLIHLIITKIKV